MHAARLGVGMTIASARSMTHIVSPSLGAAAFMKLSL
jgi:hypothetical protein